MDGKVMAEQVAVMVDKYLLDNNHLCTSFYFRNEVTSIFANYSNHEAPKNLMTLSEMFEDYISLKKQKIMMDQEEAILKQQKDQNQKLFEIIARNAMTSYNKSGGKIPTPPAKSTSMAVPQPPNRYKSRPGVATAFVQNKLYTEFQPPESNSNVNSGNYSTSSIVNVSGTKRKESTSAMDVPLTAKKPCNTSFNTKILNQGPGLLEQFSVSSVSSQSDKNTPCDREVMPTSNYKMMPSKRVMATPTKQTVSVEMSHCIPPVMTNSDKPSNCDHVEIMRSFDSDEVPNSLSNQLVEINNDSIFDLNNIDDDDLYNQLVEQIDFTR